MKTDVLIVGSGVAAMSCALSLPVDLSVLIITKKKWRDSNSYLAQGGICVSKGDDDRDPFIEDTLKAGHYKNKKEAVEVLVDESIPAIESLISWGVDFDRDENGLNYTREGGHGTNRILHCKDHSGASIMDSLIEECESRENIKVIEDCTMVDLLVEDNTCYGIVAEDEEKTFKIYSDYSVLATGGVGGLYKNSTNFRHITGDGLVLSSAYGVELEDVQWVQIHPTTFYEDTDDRRFLISESLRGEGAYLVNSRGQTFIDSLLARDVVTDAIYKEMKKEDSDHMWLDTKDMKINIKTRFPQIYEYLEERGIDPTKEDIPIIPAQHFIMGGVQTDLRARTSMDRLYGVGEVACTGVHGHNRLASNSLLECVVFGKRAGIDIGENYCTTSLPERFDKGNLVVGEEIVLDKLNITK